MLLLALMLRRMTFTLSLRKAPEDEETLVNGLLGDPRIG